MAIMASIMGVTVNITVSNKCSRQARFVAVAAIAAGIVLLVLGLPRLVAAVIALDPQNVVSRVHSGGRMPSAELEDAGHQLALAGNWVMDGELAGERSLVLMWAALDAAGPDAYARQMAEAEAGAVAALAAAPVQPGTWARLAWMREVRGDIPGAVAAFRMSMLSGGFVPAMMKSRVDQGLRLRPHLDQETERLWMRQIRLAWVIAPNFVEVLGRQAETQHLVSDALAGLSDFERARFRKLHGGP